MTRRNLVSRSVDVTQATAVNRQIGGCEIYCSSASHEFVARSESPSVMSWATQQIFDMPFTFTSGYQRVYLSVTIPRITISSLPAGYSDQFPITGQFKDWRSGLVSTGVVRGVTNGPSMVLTNVGDFAAGRYDFCVQLTFENREDAPYYYLGIEEGQMQVILGQVVDEGECFWSTCA